MSEERNILQLFEMNDTMQYDRLTDGTSLIVGETGESQLWSLSLGANRKIHRTRKKVLILLSIQLILCVILLMIGTLVLIEEKGENYRKGIRTLAPMLLWIIYYGGGLAAVYRYYHPGIYTFAWLGFLQYISVCAEVFLAIIWIIKYRSDDLQARIGVRIGFTITIISAHLIVLLMVTLHLTFKLIRFLKIFKREFLEQI